MAALPDREAKERIGSGLRLPRRGMQVRFEYTVHGHFRLLHRLISHADKVRFFMDQDDTLRAACLSSFAWEILNSRADAFFVQIDKSHTIDARRQTVRATKKRYEQVRRKLGQPDWSDRKLRLFIIREQLRHFPSASPWRDRWIEDPEHTMHEPDKAVCYLTDRGDYAVDRLAALHSRASLHAIDRYFMQLRRLLSMLERPIATPSNVGRVWRGHSPYNPEIVQKILDIFRVHYNYVKAERPRKNPAGERLPPRTPAMKLGLAKGQVRIEDILYFHR